MKTTLFLSAFAAVAYARCPNGCSNQGLCGPNSQCKCYRNFQGSDCSERVCFYAHAFVDTPYGDLNADGEIGMTVTFEEQTQDYALEGYSINYGAARAIDGLSESSRWDEAHFYRECSNKGTCNRKTGQCDCFPGYEGEGCQRTTCPGTSVGVTCSGHGLCMNAYSDQPSYNLWDQQKTMKCQCDAGYTGPDCSLRQCPVGADPVEHSDKVTTSLQKITWGTIGYKPAHFENTNAFDEVVSGPVFWTVTVTDDYGDEWTTNTLSIEYGTNCDTTELSVACSSWPVFNRDDSWTGGARSVDTTDATTIAASVAANLLTMPASNPSDFDWFASTTIADSLNQSLQALPNGAVDSPYVWMWYTASSPLTSSNAIRYADAAAEATGVAGLPEVLGVRTQDIKYPADISSSTAHYSGKTAFWNSPRTRYPDFNSNSHLDKKWWDCGRIDGKEDVNNDGFYTGTDGDATATGTTAQPGRVTLSTIKDRTDDANSVVSTEGLCLYVSSKNSIQTNYKITYSYNSYIYTSTAAGSVDREPSYYGQLQVGQSFDVVTDITGAGVNSATQRWLGDDPDAAGLLGGLVPLVTVEEVGKYRYWDVNVDGYPALSYQTRTDAVGSPATIESTFTASECSKRGLCDESTGECQCFSGYTGIACSAQNAIAYSS